MHSPMRLPKKLNEILLRSMYPRGMKEEVFTIGSCSLWIVAPQIVPEQVPDGFPKASHPTA